MTNDEDNSLDRIMNQLEEWSHTNRKIKFERLSGTTQ